MKPNENHPEQYQIVQLQYIRSNSMKYELDILSIQYQYLGRLEIVDGDVVDVAGDVPNYGLGLRFQHQKVEAGQAWNRWKSGIRLQKQEKEREMIRLRVLNIRGFTGIPVADSDYIREIWIRIWVATYNAEISNWVKPENVIIYNIIWGDFH